MTHGPADTALYQGVFQAMTEGCAVHELVHDADDRVVDYRLLDINPAYTAITGLEREAVVDRLATEVYKTHAAPYLEPFARVAMTGEPESFEVHFRPMAKHFRISIFSPRLDAFVTVFSDITREKQESAALEAEVARASNELEQTSALLQQALDSKLLLDSVACAVFTVDAQRRVTSWNHEAGLITGYSAEEILGEPCSVFAKAPCTEGCRLLDGGTCEALRGRECTVRCKDGSELSILKNAVALHDDEGRVIGTVESFVDITDERNAREKLVASEHKLRSLFEHLDSGCAIYRPVDDGQDFVFRDLNVIGERLEGVARLSLVGRRVTDCFPGIEEMGLLDVFRRVGAGGDPEELPAVVYQDDRLEGWRENYVFRLPDGDIAAIYRDRTEEKRVEHELARYKDTLEVLVGERTQQLQDEVSEHVRTRHALVQSEARLRAIFGALPDLVFLLDEDGRYREVLTGHDELLMKPQEQVQDARIHDFFAPELAGRFMGLVERTITSGDSQRIEYVLELPEGIRHFEGRSASLEQPVQGHRAMVFVARDITDRKLLEGEVRELNRDLEERVRRRTVALEAANKELEAFAYSVSHDLRAPLRAIDGFSRAVLEDYADALDADGREYLERLCTASQRMGVLIDDLLKLSRLTRRGFEPRRVDLSLMAREYLDGLAQQEPERDLDAHIAEGLVVRGDPALLRVAMQNLLENAWKFTGQRPVAWIRVTGARLEDGLAISVSDNGAGFDMAYADKLFGPFQRLHGMAEFPGNGIGLATVKRAVLRHGGDVRAEGEVGEGATFTIIIPDRSPDLDSVPPPGGRS